MQRPQFRISDFEGPLDLLLALLQKHRISIYDIEISLLVEQYLAFLQAQPEEDLEGASEFLEMAARLVQIKTAMLLPRHEEEGEALRQQLAGELLEYQACRRMAEGLRALYQGDRVFAGPGEPPPAGGPYPRVHQPAQLWRAYRAAMGRGRRRLPPPAAAFSPLVARRVVPVSSRMVHILRRLYRGPGLTFSALFAEPGDRSERVATFMALLELVRAGRVGLAEDDEGLFLKDRPSKRREGRHGQ